MTDRTLGVALLGCGFIARTHIRSVLQFAGEVRIVALCDRSGQCGCDTLEFLRSFAAEEAARVASQIEGEPDPAVRARLAARRDGLLAAAAWFAFGGGF